MTNGEKIREAFPNARIEYHKATDLVDEHVTVFINGCDTCQDYSMEWWNAEYIEPIKALEQEPTPKENLVEEQVILSGDGYADGNLVYDFGECPTCGRQWEYGDTEWEEPFCCHCGQKLHWFDREVEDGNDD